MVMGGSDGRSGDGYGLVWWVKVLGGQGLGRRRNLAPPGVLDDRKVGRIAGFFSGMEFRIEEFVCFGRFGWQWNGEEQDICSRKMVDQERFQTEKIFFGHRAVLGRGRCGGEKDVRAREIVVLRVQEACIEEV